MKVDIRAKLEALGPELSPAMIQGTQKVMIPLVAASDSSVQVTRDQHYGPDERNRLDVFRKGVAVGAPVLVYIHGGGFVMGDKTTPGSPFFDNVGQWVAQQGWIGVTITYRLAPTHRWPSGPEDMARTVSWLREHVAEYGGDPQKLFLVGQSAGAAHVAAYIANERFHPGSAGIAGAVLISGVLDLSSQPANPYSAAYFGDNPATIAEADSIAGLVGTSIPLLFTVSEFDPRDFQDQAAQLTRAWHGHKGRYPPMAYLAGHNHISPALSIGSAEDQLSRCIAEFVAVVSRT
ncbi:MAG: alpha/beta hydrolase [Pseudomonadota bacterium]